MDANGRPSTIVLKANEGTRYEEARAGGAISPGHIGILNSDGEIVVHATAAGIVPGMLVVTEELNVLQGLTKDDAYASGDLVSYRPASKGDEYLLKLEASHAITTGDQLESAGDGTLQPVSGNFPVVVALEDIASVASVQWIKSRVI